MWRGVALGAALVTGLCIALLSVSSPYQTVNGQQQLDSLPAEIDRWIVVRNWEVPTGQMVVVIEPTQRVMGSYLVNSDSGLIELKSVRRFEWDLRLEQFNASDPMPQQIREMVERP